MKENFLFTLYKLAEIGAYPGEIELTTGEIGEKIEFSQQTASRHLIELENKDLIRRTRRGRKETIKITDEGMDMLRDMYIKLQRILEETKQKITISGILFSGFGEGAYYISHDGYRKEFIKKLGFEPFPGTLNLRLSGEELNKKKMIETSQLITINGFSNGSRSFGTVKCCKASINDEIDGTVVFALRTHYGDDVVEIISSYNLREKLRLNDGDEVRITILNF